MAKAQSTYPTAIDTTLQEDRQAGQVVTSTSYDIIEDAIFHLETKVGIDNSLETTSLEYMAKHTGLTLGYIPYRKTAALVLSDSPFYTDGTSIGLGTITPARKLDILDTTNPQLRLSYSGAAYAEFRTGSNGDLTITTGDHVIIGASDCVSVDETIKRLDIGGFTGTLSADWHGGNYGQFIPKKFTIVHGSESTPVTDACTTMSIFRYDDTPTTWETGAYFIGQKDKKTIAYQTLAVTLSSASVTAVAISEAIPSNTPQTGCIEVIPDNVAASPVVCIYSSWTASTFTISAVNFNTSATSALSGANKVYIVRGAAKDALVVYSESNICTPYGVTVDNGIISIAGVGTVLSGSNAFACGLYADMTLNSELGAISGLEICVRNWTESEAPDLFIAGGTTGIKIVGRGGGTASLHTYALDVAADSGFEFKTGIHFGTDVCTVRALDLSDIGGTCVPILLHNNTSIEVFDATATSAFAIIGTDLNTSIHIGAAALSAIVIGDQSINDNPIWVRVGGQTVQMSAGANGSGGTGVRALVVANSA